LLEAPGFDHPFRTGAARADATSKATGAAERAGAAELELEHPIDWAFALAAADGGKGAAMTTRRVLDAQAIAQLVVDFRDATAGVETRLRAMGELLPMLPSDVAARAFVKVKEQHFGPSYLSGLKDHPGDPNQLSQTRGMVTSLQLALTEAGIEAKVTMEDGRQAYVGLAELIQQAQDSMTVLVAVRKNIAQLEQGFQIATRAMHAALAGR
jgi:hypothetical protein